MRAKHFAALKRYNNKKTTTSVSNDITQSTQIYHKWDSSDNRSGSVLQMNTSISPRGHAFSPNIRSDHLSEK